MNVFIFAIDGASPDLVNDWIEKGHLPNLEKIKRDGLFGNLKSTFPPLTGPAWSSFQTGVNPGKHGVFNWLDLSNSYRGEPINSTKIKTETVWNLISQGNGQVGVISLPLTYPPEKVNGFVVPGFLTPSEESETCYPKRVGNSLFNTFPQFKFQPPFFFPALSVKEWIEKLKLTIQTRGEASRYLYKTHLSSDSDTTFLVHFFSTDLVQHRLWGHDGEESNPILEVFKETDREIGKAIELAPPKSTFIVISDHGFGAVDKIFNVNNWLKKRGLLKFKKRPSTSIKRKLAHWGLTKERLKPFGEKLYTLFKNLNLVDNPITDPLTSKALSSLFLSHKDVNWKKTKAYSRSDIGHIRLNIKGREKNGVLSQKTSRKLRKKLISKLQRVTLPNKEDKLAEWVKPKEDIYHGPSLNSAPDILFNPLPKSAAGYGAAMFTAPGIFNIDPLFDPGHHRREGVIFATGPSVNPGPKDASILDLAPTLLNLHRIPIPNQMDGNVIREIAPEPPSYENKKGFYKSKEDESSNEQARDRLKNLGYL